MAHEFKYVKLPDEHGFNDEHVKFLETLDKALEGAVKGASSKKDIDEVKENLTKQLAELKTEFNYEKMQEQLNDLYKKMDPLARAPLSVEDEKKKVRALNAKWVKAFLKQDKATMKEIVLQEKETVWPAHILHTGDNSEIDSGSAAQGGYLIPELFDTEIHRYIQEGGLARREMRYLPFSGPGNERKLHTLLTSVAVSWIDEGEVKPKDKPTFAQLTQELKVLAVIVLMTEEILEDAAIDLVSLCSQLIGEAIAVEEDTQFFMGTGAPWTGIVNAVGITPAIMQAGVGRDELTPSHFLALKYSLTTAQRRGGKFYMHPEIWAYLRSYRASAVASADQEGNYLVQEPTGGEPSLLWGSPVVESEVLPDWDDINDVDEPIAIYSNLQRTCVYGDKLGTRVKLLDQATVTDSDGNSINLAERDMMALRVHRRVGFLPVLPQGIAVLFTGPVS